MKLGRTITSLAVGGAALALIGAGVGSTFTASGTATEKVSVGTFDAWHAPVRCGNRPRDNRHCGEGRDSDLQPDAIFDASVPRSVGQVRLQLCRKRKAGPASAIYGDA